MSQQADLQKSKAVGTVETAPHRRAGVSALLVGILIAGCSDPSKEPYERCLKLEKEGRLDDAWSACSAAVVSAPTKPGGRAAAERLKALAPAHERRLREIARKAGAASSSAQAAKTGGAAASAAPPPGRLASLVLTENPDLLVHPDKSRTDGGPEGTLEAIALWNSGTLECHELTEGIRAVAAKDEFAKRDFEKTDRPKLVANCEARLREARSYLEHCPASVTQDVTIGEYDFKNQAFPLTSSRSSLAKHLRLTADRRVVAIDSALITWPMAPKPYPDPTATGSSLLCKGATGEWDAALEEFRIDLPMSETEAKAFRARLPQTPDLFVEVAFVLDSGNERAALGCGLFTTKRLPTGRALAWRLTLLDLASSESWPANTRALSGWLAVSTFDDSTACGPGRNWFAPPIRGGQPSASATPSARP
jgi:hypothetical protein